MRIHVLEDSALSKEDFTTMISKFLDVAKEVLEIDTLPRIIFRTKIVTQDDQPSFGMYLVGQNILEISLTNRHPIDILRTMAHELVHYKQDLDGVLDDDSGETGSDHENEANARAGVIMRLFSKQNPQYMLLEPMIKK